MGIIQNIATFPKQPLLDSTIFFTHFLFSAEMVRPLFCKKESKWRGILEISNIFA
jgi:hypothetical protein